MLAEILYDLTNNLNRMHKRAPNPTEILEAHKIIMGRASYSIQDITRHAERLGIDTDNSMPSSPPSEEQQIRNYINKNYVRFDATIIGTSNNNNSNESSELTS
ncbi:MAG: hypothetical protein WCF23_10570 [Candidatus Nitrosopolaris sp.]